jgi:hypothetical protein
MNVSVLSSVITVALTLPLIAVENTSVVSESQDHQKVVVMLRAGLQKLDADGTRRDRLLDLLKQASGENSANILVTECLDEALTKSKANNNEADAAKEVERGITCALDILTFEVVQEAKLPQGFPRATPLGEIRVKSYPAYRAATAEMGDGADSAFFSLFRHITANQIAMTAPVEITYDSKSRSTDPRKSSMSFFYEHPDLGRSGVRDSVSVIDGTPQLFLSIGMRGDMTGEALAKGRGFLRTWLKAHADEYRDTGHLRVLGYNSPMVLPTLRYFEVQLSIERVPH